MNKADIMVVGSMGHVSSFSLGVALQSPKRKVYCLDGDGSLIMHMGALPTIGKYSSSNFRHILLNNFSHDSVGGRTVVPISLIFHCSHKPFLIRIILKLGINLILKKFSLNLLSQKGLHF